MFDREGRGRKQKGKSRPGFIYPSSFARGSHDTTADGDTVGDGKLDNLDTFVGGEPDVEVLDGDAVRAVEIRQGRVIGQRHRAAPERVVVDDEAADADEAEELLVVPHVVGLVGIDERHVEPSKVPVVGEQLGEVVQRGALAEVHLVLDAGLLDELAADAVVVVAFCVDGDDFAVVGQGERRGEKRVAGVHAHLDGVLGARDLHQHPQQLRLVRRRRHDPPACVDASTTGF
ncbi:hypothetical protein EJB05_49494, partial [Eragrostis curvula]